MAINLNFRAKLKKRTIPYPRGMVQKLKTVEVFFDGCLLLYCNTNPENLHVYRNDNDKNKDATPAGVECHSPVDSPINMRYLWYRINPA